MTIEQQVDALKCLKQDLGDVILEVVARGCDDAEILMPALIAQHAAARQLHLRSNGGYLLASDGGVEQLYEKVMGVSYRP